MLSLLSYHILVFFFFLRPELAKRVYILLLLFPRVIGSLSPIPYHPIILSSYHPIPIILSSYPYHPIILSLFPILYPIPIPYPLALSCILALCPILSLFKKSPKSFYRFFFPIPYPWASFYPLFFSLMIPYLSIYPLSYWSESRAYPILVLILEVNPPTRGGFNG